MIGHIDHAGGAKPYGQPQTEIAPAQQVEAKLAAARRL